MRKFWEYIEIALQTKYSEEIYGDFETIRGISQCIKIFRDVSTCLKLWPSLLYFEVGFSQALV